MRLLAGICAWSNGRALLDLQASGKTRSVGVSNFNESHLDEIAEAGLQMPDANPNRVASLVPRNRAFCTTWPSMTSRPSPTAALPPLSTWRIEPGQDSAKTDQMKADGTALWGYGREIRCFRSTTVIAMGGTEGLCSPAQKLEPRADAPEF